jgi:hypothetical protein
VPGFPIRHFDRPLWDGTPLGERTLLVHAEQGLGDTLHFVRYLKLARRLAPKLIFSPQPALVPLLRHSGMGDVLVEDTMQAAFDLHVPLLSLPGILGTRGDNIPSDVPYLSVPRELVEKWRTRLAAIDGLRIGIAWQGSRGHVGDRERSIPFSSFAPLAQVEGVTLISLQKGDGTQQLAQAGFGVRTLGDDWDESAGPLVDTAAAMQHLDLVVTADTAIAHLAGALGVRVFVALATRADWRWFRSASDTPWYPTMTLFRQSRAGDWGEVFARIVREVRGV